VLLEGAKKNTLGDDGEEKSMTVLGSHASGGCEGRRLSCWELSPVKWEHPTCGHQQGCWSPVTWSIHAPSSSSKGTSGSGRSNTHNLQAGYSTPAAAG
jgi:hypothetical protein